MQSIQSNELSRKRTFLILLVLQILFFAAIFSVNAFATGGAVSGVEGASILTGQLASKIYKFCKIICIPVGAFGVARAGFVLLTSTSKGEQAMAEAIVRIKHAAIAICVILLIGLVFNQSRHLVEKSHLIWDPTLSANDSPTPFIQSAGDLNFNNMIVNPGNPPAIAIGGVADFSGIIEISEGEAKSIIVAYWMNKDGSAWGSDDNPICMETYERNPNLVNLPTDFGDMLDYIKNDDYDGKTYVQLVAEGYMSGKDVLVALASRNWGGHNEDPALLPK